MNSLPKDFLLGAATAAHQVEGNNTHSDYWLMEQMEHTSFVEPSLDSVDHYHRYEEDILLLKNAGLNAYRFSIEWARIEPEEGTFDENEVEHYRKVIRFLKEQGIEPVVTLLHFTSPYWLMEKGGWEDESVITYFERYVSYIAEQLGSELHIVCTINEANMGLQIGDLSKRYIREMLRPKKKDVNGQVQVGINLSSILKNMKYTKKENMEVFHVKNPQTFIGMHGKKGDEIVIKAHQAAKKVLKEKCPHLKVGLTLSLHDIQYVKGGEKEAKKVWESEFRHYLPFIGEDDFIGIQNYTRSVYDKHGLISPSKDAELTQMAYEFYPEGLEHVLRKVHEEYKGDLIITENGIATDDDSRRIEYIQKAMAGVLHCIEDGLPIKGYMHWSLLDNFEWQKGYSMHFGLIRVNRITKEREAKESLNVLGSYKTC